VQGYAVFKYIPKDYLKVGIVETEEKALLLISEDRKTTKMMRAEYYEIVALVATASEKVQRIIWTS
jgi:hypothetical protein